MQLLKLFWINLIKYVIYKIKGKSSLIDDKLIELDQKLKLTLLKSQFE